MFQMFPYHSLLAECLRFSSVMAGGGGGRTHFGSFLRTIPSIHPHAFDADSRSIESPPVHITMASRCERVGVDVQEMRRERVRRWESTSDATYAPELT